MFRDIDMNEVSDGKRYKANDMVKAGTNGCMGCSKCCREMADTIRLDPYDIYQLEKGLGISFEEMLVREYVELNLVDGIICPNLKPAKQSGACPFLNKAERCSIHEFRPGFCRLFPLGRIYEEGDFDYYLQVKECPCPNKSKVKVRQWLGVPELARYEDFVLRFHGLLLSLEDNFAQMPAERQKAAQMGFLTLFFRTPYDTKRDFYEQYEERLAKIFEG